MQKRRNDSTAVIRGIRTVAILALVVLVAGVPAQAAEPSEGTVSKKQDATWSGGPFTASNPIECLGPDDPTCDHFLLTVDAKEGTPVLVAIATERPEEDDYDLFVYRPDGTLAAFKATGSGNESVVFEHSLAHGPGPYEVRVQPFLVTPGSTYRGIAMVSRERVDIVRDCLEAVPESVGVAGVTDEGQDVELAVMVLLDGVSRERGEKVMAAAAKSYGPLNIILTSKFRPVSFAGDEDDDTRAESDDLLQQAKDVFHGERPNGSDVVYVLTTKDIRVGSVDIVGRADCIGGVRYPERAFAVSEELIALENQPLGPFVTLVEGTAKVVAHEVGHLMGAHHHYANCAEGVEENDVAGLELSPCTLMFPRLRFGSFPFSTLSAAVVRGHAVDFASP